MQNTPGGEYDPEGGKRHLAHLFGFSNKTPLPLTWNVHQLTKLRPLTSHGCWRRRVQKPARRGARKRA